MAVAKPLMHYVFDRYVEYETSGDYGKSQQLLIIHTNSLKHACDKVINNDLLTHEKYVTIIPPGTTLDQRLRIHLQNEEIIDKYYKEYFFDKYSPDHIQSLINLNFNN